MKAYAVASIGHTDEPNDRLLFQIDLVGEVLRWSVCIRVNVDAEAVKLLLVRIDLGALRPLNALVDFRNIARLQPIFILQLFLLVEPLQSLDHASLFRGVATRKAIIVPFVDQMIQSVL